MRIDVVTLFPEMVGHAARFGVTGRALERGLWRLGVWNPRDFVTDNYRTIDDRPYGGGPGMVMLAEPLAKALAAARAAQRADGCKATRTLHLSPAGKPLAHKRVAELAGEAEETGYLLLAGRYEGIDERLIEREVDEEIAIGDFVVSGGELPALMLIDAVVRQRPGVLNDALSAAQDSFAAGLLDCPHYTRPEVEDGDRVPDVLLSGNHASIRAWRLQQSLGRTWERRPDLFRDRVLSKEEEELLASFKRERSKAGGNG
ncbi:MAG: tRNA (guanosine(37)-N1)-methyltransferase TrmD [Betaproteobacteria bacterium]